MINFKSNYKSDYNKIVEDKSNNDNIIFKSTSRSSIRVNYSINSDRTRTSNDRFTKVVLSK